MRILFIISLFILGCANMTKSPDAFDVYPKEMGPTNDHEAIRQVIRQNIKSFEACYNDSLRRNKDAYGKIEIEWDIIEKGAVKNAKTVSSTLNDPKLDDCMVKVVAKLTFPEPPATQIARVRYPFVFSSRESAK